MSLFVADQLSEVLHAKLTIGKINIGLLNRILVDDVLLDDQEGKELLKITRLSAKFDIIPLFKGKVSISSVQLFGFNAALSKETLNSPPNFKFIIDAFASKDTLKKESALDLRINSILIRRGKVSYDVLSEGNTPGKFNPKHLQFQNIRANISLKALNSDSLNFAIKRMSFDESASGFSLKKMSMKLVANNTKTSIENFDIELPETSLKMDTIHLKYHSPDDFNYFAQKVNFSFRTLPSIITLKDLSPFVPALSHFKEPITLDVDVKGTVDQLVCSRLEISTKDRQVRLSGDASFQDLSHPQDAYVFGTLSELYADVRGVGFLVRNLSPNYNGIPPILERLGGIDFRGEVSGYFTDLVTYGLLRTNLGNVQTDLKLSVNKETGLFAYSGRIKTETFELGNLINNKNLGEITLNLDINGRHTPNSQPVIEMKGIVSSLDYNKYNYENIALDGEYKNGGFSGKASLDDPNGTIHLSGDINTASKTPTFNFLAVADRVRPHELNLTSKYIDAEFSVRLRANFTGGSINDMIGEINIDSLKFAAPDKDYFMQSMNIKASKHDKENRFDLTSEFLTVSIVGDYQYQSLPASIMNILHDYVPSLIKLPKKTVQTANNFVFDVNLYNTEILSTVFNIPLTLYTHSTLKGYFNDAMHRLRVEGYFPRLLYGNKYIESGMILCENPSDYVHAKVRFTSLKKNGAVNLSLEAKAKDDKVSTILNWGNNAVETYSGQLSTLAHFFRSSDDLLLKAKVDVNPTDIILNDTVWQIDPSQVVVDSGKVIIDNFNFSHGDRHVRINGQLSSNPLDTVKIDLNDINLGYVFDIANISDDVDFEGDATGTAYVCGVFKKPEMNARLAVRNFSLNKSRLGDLNIFGAWNNEKRSIYLDAAIMDEDSLPSLVTGHVYPLKPESGLDLNIDAHHLNMKFLEYYMNSIARDIKGRVTGKVHFYGKFKALNLDGAVMTDASMMFDVLNTRFAIKDTIRLSPNGLAFDKIHIEDMEGHTGTLDGYLHFTHFKNLNYYFAIRAKNMLLMNTKESADMPFYGTIYATGNAVLAGNAIQGLDVNAALTTNRNSVFTYINGSVTSATSNQFIKFVDKTPRNSGRDTIQTNSYFEQFQQKQQLDNDEHQTDIRLNLLIDATPDATMRIIMDPIAGDYISGKGSGSIRAEFYNKGDVKMFGNYRISQGIYKFSLQEVIRKDFIIKDGSNITFNGPPLDANMDIQATYTVNSVSLNDLSTDVAAIAGQRNVRVNCILNMSGILMHPTFKMGIELPNDNDEIQTLVRNYISTEEQMNMQILYLLGIGKFYTEDATQTNQNSNVMSSVLSSTLSGQLNNALSRVFETNNWNIGTNLSTGDKGWTDMEVEGVLSGQLLNNRLLINGNFGYRDNPLANTNFVGDFEAEWLINRSGDIRLKAYNETNDRYYTRTNLTTQGVGILLKKDFNKWNELFFWNKWKRRSTPNSVNEEIKTDSLNNEKAKSKQKRDHN